MEILPFGLKPFGRIFLAKHPSREGRNLLRPPFPHRRFSRREGRAMDSPPRSYLHPATTANATANSKLIFMALGNPFCSNHRLLGVLHFLVLLQLHYPFHHLLVLWLEISRDFFTTPETATPPPAAMNTSAANSNASFMLHGLRRASVTHASSLFSSWSFGRLTTNAIWADPSRISITPTAIRPMRRLTFFELQKLINNPLPQG